MLSPLDIYFFQRSAINFQNINLNRSPDGRLPQGNVCKGTLSETETNTSAERQLCCGNRSMQHLSLWTLMATHPITLNCTYLAVIYVRV